MKHFTWDDNRCEFSMTNIFTCDISGSSQS